MNGEYRTAPARPPAHGSGCEVRGKYAAPQNRRFAAAPRARGARCDGMRNGTDDCGCAAGALRAMARRKARRMSNHKEHKEHKGGA